MKIKRILGMIICAMLIINGAGITAFAADADTPAIPCVYDTIFPSSDRLFSVQQNGKWGLVDAGGTIVLPAVYDSECSHVGGGRYIVGLDGKQAIADGNGNILLGPVFDYIYGMYGDESAGTFYVHGDMNGRWIVTDMEGRELTPEGGHYVLVQIFDGIAILTRMEHPMPTVSVPYYTLYDLRTGQTLSPADCEVIQAVDGGERFLITTWADWQSGVDGNYSLIKPSESWMIDRDGNEVIPKGSYDSIGLFVDGLAPAVKSGELVLLDQTGAVSCRYEGDYSGMTIQHHGDGIIIASKDYLCGILNTKGEIVRPLSYVYMYYDRGLILAQRDYDSGFVTMNREGEILTDGQVFRQGNSEVIITGEAMYDAHGNLLIPAGKYDKIYDSPNGFIRIEKGESTGFTDVTGRELYLGNLGGVGISSARSQIIFDNGMNPALLDISGQLVVSFDKYPFMFDILPCGFVTVGDADGTGHTGLINPYGDLVLPCLFDGIAEIPGGYFIAYNGYSRSLYDINGKLIIPTGTYEDITSLSYTGTDGLIAVKKDGKWGAVGLPGVLYHPSTGDTKSWAEAELEQAAELRLIPEDMMNHFQQSVTRAEFCRLIDKLIMKKTNYDAYSLATDGEQYYGNIFPFYDVADNSSIIGAYLLGIVEGDGNGFFNPSAPLKRQEAAKMLSLAAKALGADIGAPVTDYADNADIPAWAASGVRYVTASGVMKGMEEKKFEPSKSYTREQAYLTILRLWNALSS